jgi:O-antigen ligase
MSPSANDPSSGRDRPGLLVLSAVWTMVGVVACGLAPLVAAYLLPLVPLAPLAWTLRDWRRVRWLEPAAPTFLLALAGAYLLINASWSPSPGSARAFVGYLFLLAGVLHLSACTLEVCNAAAARAMAIGLWGGLAVSGTILLVEVLTQQWGFRQLMTYVPSLRPNPRDMDLQAGQIVNLQPYLLNRSMTVLALLFWPVALTVKGLDLPARHYAAALAGLSPVAGAILLSGHATSKIALVGGSLVFILAMISSRLAGRVAAVLWIVATLLVVPITAYAYKSELYRAPWLVFSAKHRIVIWGYTAEQVAKAPLLGAGMEATRPLNDPNAPRVPGTSIPVTVGAHSHNAYLQAWYETGAVGVVFLLGIGLLLLRVVARAADDAGPYLLAAFATAALLAASSFTLWAPWFAASFGFTAVFCVLALRVRRTIGARGPGA